MRIFDSSWIGLLSGTGRPIATKSAVVLSQARGNSVYEKFLEDTFPAVPTQETAVISPLRPLEGLPEHPLSRTKSQSSATLYCCRGPVARPCFRKIARRAS